MKPLRRKLDEYSTHELAEEVARRTEERAMTLRTKALGIVNNQGNHVEVDEYTQDSSGGVTIIFEVNGGAE